MCASRARASSTARSGSTTMTAIWCRHGRQACSRYRRWSDRSCAPFRIPAARRRAGDRRRSIRPAWSPPGMRYGRAETLADFDVLIAGAGAAGAATAISLADFAPELRVGIADAPAADGLRVGETVPPQVEPLLQHLGLWPAFEADRHRPSYRMVSAWGGPELMSNEFLFQTRQVGWRLDRARFDAMMRTAAAARVRSIAAKIDAVVFEESNWRVRLGNGAHYTAGFLVDATGRGSAVARAQGVRLETSDRLAASVMLFEDAPDDGAGALIETFGD